MDKETKIKELYAAAAAITKFIAKMDKNRMDADKGKEVEKDGYKS
jgi:hypothetical protein